MNPAERPRRFVAALCAGALLRERQPAIDRLRREDPGVAASDIVAAARAPKARWEWRFYEPFVDLALRHGLPIVAANVSAADARRVMREGLGATGFDDAVPPDIVAAQARAIEDGHCGRVDASLARRMAAAQVARDQFMARRVEEHAGRGVVLLAGNGHVRRDRGVPRWLGGRTRALTVAIGLLEEGDDSHAAFDRAVTTPPQRREDPCAAMSRRPATAG